MGLEELSHEVAKKLEDWRDDLRKVSSDLERAEDRFSEVKDASSLERFSDSFDEFKKDLKELVGEVDHFSDKMKTFQKEVVNSSAKAE